VILKHKVAVSLAAAALLAGLGVASAFADNPPGGTTTTVTTATTGGGDQGDASDQADQSDKADQADQADQTDQSNQADQNDQGDDQQTTATSVSQAASAVETEADNPSADDQSGDQHGPNDQTQQSGETGQSND
jgi:hypothetical protein